jgi:hypothetical protein
MLTFIYILNATLLILHEIESGYEKEWEILKLPGKLTGFLLLHVPILFLFFYCFYFLIAFPETKGVISLVMGVAGFIPFLVHKVLVNKKEHFNSAISNVIIFGNIITGMILLVLGIVEIIK